MAINVHRALGPGLLESAYEHCLGHELHLNGIEFARQVPLPIRYKDTDLECGYRLDLVVENVLLLELKAVDGLTPLHDAQIITYLRLSGLKTGLLMNFNTTMLKNGIRRFVA
ncbi:MAG: GxxExxY protein [Rhodospirillaceae bacterium BRH_c57]|nr:MAG: GxxExxY protein [Rhodospirillaceae bacterium BRH_c57]